MYCLSNPVYAISVVTAQRGKTGAKAIQCSKIEKKKKTYPYLTCKKEVYGDPHLTPHTLTSEGPELTQGLSAAELLAFPTG